MSPATVVKVRELLAQRLEVPASDDAALELSSFVVVDLVEALEDTFGIQITAAQVTPENFGSVARIAALIMNSTRPVGPVTAKVDR